MGPNVNKSSNDNEQFLSKNEHLLIFCSKIALRSPFWFQIEYKLGMAPDLTAVHNGQNLCKNEELLQFARKLLIKLYYSHT